MNTGVRIVKRGVARGPQSILPGRDEKTVRQGEREIARTVKSWVAESARRRRAAERSAMALLEPVPS